MGFEGGPGGDIISLHWESQFGVFVGVVGESGGVRSALMRCFGEIVGLPEAIHFQNEVSSSSSGTSIMVTCGPLFTTWALAASFLLAVLPGAGAPPPGLGPAGFLWCPEGVSGWTIWFLVEGSPRSAKCHSGTTGST